MKQTKKYLSPFQVLLILSAVSAAFGLVWFLAQCLARLDDLINGAPIQ